MKEKEAKHNVIIPAKFLEAVRKVRMNESGFGRTKIAKSLLWQPEFREGGEGRDFQGSKREGI